MSRPRAPHASDPEAGPESRPSRTSFADGELVGLKYRLVRRLGEGGMAEVWVAHDHALDIDVALKFIRGDLEHPELDDRLLQEARAAAKLGHPAIVRVLDYGRTGKGVPFIGMELLAGEDLAGAIARRGRLPAARAVRTLLPIAHALATAHEKGIVHRDLKPENVYLCPQGDLVQPKLLDFGIAKLERAEARITRMGAALGSPGYMSPEQARGNDVDHRTDIWSFCVVLYEVMTGKLPFEADGYNALLRSIIEDPAPPITNFAAGDEQLWAILERGFCKSPAERWQSMHALGSALAQWLISHGVTEDVAGASLQATWFSHGTSSVLPPALGASDRAQPTVLGDLAEPPRRSRARALGAVALIALAAGIGAVVLTRSRAGSPAASSQAPIVARAPTAVSSGAAGAVPEPSAQASPEPIAAATESAAEPASSASLPIASAAPAKTAKKLPAGWIKKPAAEKKPDEFQLKKPF